MASQTGHEGVGSLIDRISRIRANSLPFFAPKRWHQTTEASLVKDVLYMLQGFASEHFRWDTTGQQFYIESGIHVTHLSMSSLTNLLVPFIAAATRLRRVDAFVKRVAEETTGSWLKFRPQAFPTLEAFANAVAMRLVFLRKAALDKELEAVMGGAGTTVTLLSLLASMSWVFAGAEFLQTVVQHAVPDPDQLFVPASNGAELASHILSSLYEQLNEICLLQDGEEEAYRTLLLLFVATLRPLTKGLDAWLQEGTLNDPSGELFFYANSLVPIEDAAFWQHGYQLRHRFAINLRESVNLSESMLKGQPLLLESGSPKRNGHNPEGAGGFEQKSTVSNKGDYGVDPEKLICPTFLQSLAKAVLSAGKSLQLLQHIRKEKEQPKGGFYSSHASMSSPSFPATPFSPSMNVLGKRHPAEVSLAMGVLSSTPVLKHASSSNWTEEQATEEEGLEHCHPQASLFEEFCISSKRLLAQDMPDVCAIPCPNGKTTWSLALEPSLNPGNSMETCGESEGGKSRQKKEGYIWRGERTTEQGHNGQQYALHEAGYFCGPDGNYLSLDHSIHVMLDTSGMEGQETQNSSAEAPLGKHPAEIKVVSAKGSFGLYGLTGLMDNSMSKSVNEDVTKKTFEELRAAFISKCKLAKPLEDSWQVQLNLRGYSQLSPLNDSQLRETIFPGEESAADTYLGVEEDAGWGSLEGFGDGAHTDTASGQDGNINGGEVRLVTGPKPGGTNYSHGRGCGNLLALHMREDVSAMERLLPYPTVLPSFWLHQQLHSSTTALGGIIQGSKDGILQSVPYQILGRLDRFYRSNDKILDGKPASEIAAPHQQNQVAAQMLEWLQQAEFEATPSPEVLVQECLISSIQRRVHAVSLQLLERLMGEWRLMEELALLRAIYLVGSGDLLQQFASVLFNKLDRGEPWDDFYELNTMLQESVRSSSHGMSLPALDSLVVTVEPRSPNPGSPPRGSSPLPLQITGRSPTSGIDTLDSMRFVYKVAWPLELIIDSNAIKKYNQVMAFLMKVKRAKHALDKACRWTWKNGGGDAAHHKQRLLLQQKLMHFVNTLHQYVMDRVLYSAWMELSEGMAAAGSLDEVIACHDSYLVSIQRQCLVAPDKLWTLIAGRVKTILGLALDYYSIQRTLCDGVAAPGITARCQLEIERVERQFDECVVFLLRVLSFRLNVGHFPHLADLVTRINYNCYYMTEDGQILTPIPDTQGQMARRPSRKN